GPRGAAASAPRRRRRPFGAASHARCRGLDAGRPGAHAQGRAADRVRPLLAGAVARLRRRRGRAVLSAVGIAAAAAMTGAAVTVSYNLYGGFARSADEAGMLDVVVHFSGGPASLDVTRVR